MSISDLLTEYIEKRNSDNARRSYKSIINSYISWRNYSLEQLIASGVKEQSHFEKYLIDPTLKIAEITRKIHISVVKGFMIFCGVKLKRYSRKKQKYYFENDSVMNDFLTLTGTREITKRGANRHLYMYCQFRDKTPTELIEELETITKPKLRVFLKQFYDSMTIQSKKAVLSRIIRFYRLLGDFRIDPPKVRSQKKLGLLLSQKQLIDKKIVRELMKVSDLRDSMIVMCCFESGLNPVDLVSFNYEDMKSFLNLENPEEITQVAVIPRIRSKTGYEFLACFGVQSLQLISFWLKTVRKNLKEWNMELTDNFPIFCQKYSPHQRLNNYSIAGILKTVSNNAGYDQPFLSSDFRNSFNTRAKQLLKHYDKELFMGHSGGLERHYDISSLEYYTNEYQKAWEMLFDLSYDHERLKSLEEKHKEMETALKDVRPILEQIFLALYDPKSDTKLTREDFEKAITRLRGVK